jgi:N6-adenosine-specific RNA methylase IME4
MTSYACLQIDPPWPEKGGGGRGAQEHYDVIDDRADILRVIATAPSWRPAADAHLWCWTTTTSLVDGLWLVDALGFRYVTHSVWCKTALTNDLFGDPNPLMGIGQYLRGAHELLLLGVRGDGYAARTEARDIPSWFCAPPPRASDGKRIHSRKPEKAYQLIEARSHGPRLEMFARVARPGWDSWGNESPAAAIAPPDTTPPALAGQGAIP